ncbi:MAG: T9SS type A sorting domain-containing protein [Ignavibacteria bacterium]|nr:T9SS type A sorting domain-containing protein [Ignavibacteria bacterium]
MNENSGWVGLANSRLARTTNGGLNWSYQLPNFSVGSTTDLYFYDSLKGWGGTRLSRILKTTTSGNVWGYQRDSSASYTISFIDSSNGWTGDMGVSHTTNGGGIITHINSYTNFIPEDYKLYQNYPNPFNSQTKISFEVKSNSFVKLIIYDITGREINIWQSNGILLSGRHEFLFDAKGLSSGVYFYKLEARTQDGVVVFSKSKKMILSK